MGGEKISKKFKLIFICLVFLFAIAAVSAQDASCNQTDDVMEVSEDTDCQTSTQDDSNNVLADTDEYDEGYNVTVKRYRTDTTYIGGKTSNGFIVYCAQHFKGSPTARESLFEYGNNYSIYTNVGSDEYVGEYIKILLYKYSDELSGKSFNLDVISKNGTVSQKSLKGDRIIQYVIWALTDTNFRELDRDASLFGSSSVENYGTDRETNQYITMVLDYLKKVITDYDNNVRIPNYVYDKIEGNKYRFYEFPSFKSQDGHIQNLVGFRVTEGIIDFEFEKVALNPIAIVGGQTEFLITINNTGDLALKDFYVTDNGIDGLIYDHFIDNTGKWSNLSSTEWFYNGILGAGKSIDITLVFNVTKEGELINVAAVDFHDNIKKSAQGFTNSYYSELEVVKESEDKLVNLGELASFIITVKNTGDIDLDDVFVEEDIPEGLIYHSYKNGTGKWKYDEGKFYLVGKLDVNGSATLTVLFKTMKLGNLTNKVTAGSNQTDNVTSEDTVEVQETEEEDDWDEIESQDEDQISSFEGGDSFDGVASKDNEISAQKRINDSNSTGNPIMLLLAVLLVVPIFRRYN